MKYQPLGQSGLLISEIIVGTSSFGGHADGSQSKKELVDQAKKILNIAFDAGVNMVDTADLYGQGRSETILGEALGTVRKDIILASKGRNPTGNGKNESGASRHHLISACEASLKRLGTDYIDLYQMHNWDGLTPIDETLEALTNLVRSGKVRYIGTSNYTGWQLTKTLYVADLKSLIRPIAQQIHYSPESRDAEYELLPAAIDQQVGTIIWSPLAKGAMAGRLRQGKSVPQDFLQTEARWTEPYMHDIDRAMRISEVLLNIAEELAVSPARVCLAWLKNRPAITGIIVGSTDEQQMKDNLAATDLTLSAEHTQQITDVSAQNPRYPYWHRITTHMDRIDPAESSFLAEAERVMRNQIV